MRRRQSLGVVDSGCPVEWGHPLCRGLAACYAGVPNSGWAGSTVFRDLVRGAKYPNDGTVVGNPTWASGTGALRALRLDAAGDYVTLPSTIDSFPDNTATLAVFCKFRVATPATIGDTGFTRLTTTTNLNQSTHYPYTDGTGYFNTFLNGRVGPVTLSSAVVRTTWHLLTVTSTPGAGGWIVYQNNIQLTTSTGQATINLDETNGLWLGRSDNPGAGSAPFEMDGLIGGAMLWRRALSAREVAGVWNQFQRGLPDMLRWVGPTRYFAPQQAAAAGNRRRRLIICGSGQ